MKVWITKYALTDGIIEEEAKLCSEDMIKVEGRYFSYFHSEGKEWHRTEEAAKARAEEMRKKKIASLQKQLKKYEKMRF